MGRRKQPARPCANQKCERIIETRRFCGRCQKRIQRGRFVDVINREGTVTQPIFPYPTRYPSPSSTTLPSASHIVEGDFSLQQGYFPTLTPALPAAPVDLQPQSPYSFINVLSETPTSKIQRPSHVMWYQIPQILYTEPLSRLYPYTLPETTSELPEANTTNKISNITTHNPETLHQPALHEVQNFLLEDPFDTEEQNIFN